MISEHMYQWTDVIDGTLTVIINEDDFMGDYTALGAGLWNVLGSRKPPPAKAAAQAAPAKAATQPAPTKAAPPRPNPAAATAKAAAAVAPIGQWGVNEVVAHFASLGATEASIAKIRDEQIDGSSLELLSSAELRSELGLSLGVVKKHERSS
jgi:hypothetical protein